MPFFNGLLSLMNDRKPPPRCFAPLENAGCRILILGSMPGVESLRQQQYYAHPRNAFWPIMASLFGIGSHLPYAERCAHLVANRIALWDVMRTCQRSGSLDSAIERDSIQANNFPAFFRSHRHLNAVFFNGAAAEQTFQRKVARQHADADWLPETRIRLPSTSPANARLAVDDKIHHWQIIRQHL